MDDIDYPTIDYAEMPPSLDNGPLSVEYNFFRREIGRLLAEGREGQYVLIKGEEIIGFFDTEDQASDEGYRRFLLSGFMIDQVARRRRVYRGPYRMLCRTLPTQ